LTRFRQIDEGQRRASLRPIAVLRLEPNELAARYGLKFRPDERDTGTAALLETESGRQYMLLRQHDAPEPGDRGARP
jgi:hypothetical protein